MPDTCLVTFTARDSGFAVLPGQTVTFVPTGSLLAGQNTNLLARTTRTVVADGGGAGSVALVPGTYRLETMGSDGLIAAPIIVPDVLTATIGECLDALAQASFSQMQVALLAASAGRMFETPALGYASAAVAVDDVFLALNAGVLSVYRKSSPTTGTLLGPLFTTGSFASGLTVNGLITGTAVTQNNADTTAGRITKVGDFGLGALGIPDVDANATNMPTRFFRSSANHAFGTFWGHSLHLSRQLNAQGAQLSIRDAAATEPPLAAIRHRGSTGAWSEWSVLFGRLNLLGAVSQTGGIPTGAAIERGSNANGEFVRFADGTQICTATQTPNVALTTASAALGFRNDPAAVWTFPATFAQAPVPQITTNTGGGAVVTCSTTGMTYVIGSVTSQAAAARTVYLTAIGRWF